jgi:hypothetical protein
MKYNMKMMAGLIVAIQVTSIMASDSLSSMDSKWNVVEINTKKIVFDKKDEHYHNPTDTSRITLTLPDDRADYIYELDKRYSIGNKPFITSYDRILKNTSIKIGFTQKPQYFKSEGDNFLIHEGKCKTSEIWPYFSCKTHSGKFDQTINRYKKFLNNFPNIDDETKEKVLATIREEKPYYPEINYLTDPDVTWHEDIGFLPYTNWYEENILSCKDHSPR